MMKPLVIAGNWKSNKTSEEAMEWLQNFQFSISNFQLQNTSIILCASFTLLYPLKEEIKKQSLPLVLGAQDASAHPEGAYTGAVSVRQVKELADWVIIGHSERRKYFGEIDEILAKKVEQAKLANLKIIYCVPDERAVVPKGVDAVAYEPVWAIGTGKTDTPENANTAIASLKQKFSISRVLYGGSVTPENAASFVAQPAIDGVLVGGASLDALIFAALIRNICNQS